MIRVIGFTAALILAGLPALAETTEEQRAAIAAAIEENGCRVTADNNAAILEAAGLSEADAATVVQALIEAGTAVIENGELMLKSEACP